MPRTDPDRGVPSTRQEPERAASPAASNARGRIRALVSLLADDSPSVREEVRAHLLAAGRAARPELERAARGDEPRARSRARGLLLELDRHAAVRRTLSYSAREELDLERALFLIARVHAPRLDPRPYQRALDAMAAEVARRARGKTDELQRALTLCEYLGGELGFGGSVGEFHHPDNIHVHRAIERKAGMPLALCAVYLFVARRAGLRAALIPLPGQVMLRLYGSWQSAIVDPYQKGRLRTEAECRSTLKARGLPWRAASFRDADDKTILRRQAANLLRSAQLRGQKREAREMATLLRGIEPRAIPRGAAADESGAGEASPRRAPEDGKSP